jgi:patatin-like phospholipase/acyl hydrolase
MARCRATQLGCEPKPDSYPHPLYLLSLDGGGVCGLSSLYMLKVLMAQLNDQRQSVGLARVKPCEVFDLIGGTGTGG